MRRRWCWAVILVASLAGCTDTVSLVPVSATTQGGNARMDYFAGLPRGPLSVKMPDGEVLPGSFQVSQGELPADGSGNFHATAQGPRTSLVCHANLVSGHGPGECRAQDGTTYRVQF